MNINVSHDSWRVRLIGGRSGKGKPIGVVGNTNKKFSLVTIGARVSSSQTVDLGSLYFIFHFHFILFSYFSIFRTARDRVRSDWSHCHINHNLMVWS